LILEPGYQGIMGSHIGGKSTPESEQSQKQRRLCHLFLKPDRKQCAIYRNRMWGPVFGCFSPDFAIHSDCHMEGSGTHAGGFGKTYRNGTGLKGETFLTRSQNFTVKEIEVFEIKI
jgi:hypothetical protein